MFQETQLFLKQIHKLIMAEKELSCLKYEWRLAVALCLRLCYRYGQLVGSLDAAPKKAEASTRQIGVWTIGHELKRTFI